MSTLTLQCVDRLESSESDVYRRQILTTKVDPRTVRVKRYETRMLSENFWGDREKMNKNNLGKVTEIYCQEKVGIPLE